MHCSSSAHKFATKAQVRHPSEGTQFPICDAIFPPENIGELLKSIYQIPQLLLMTSDQFVFAIFSGPANICHNNYAVGR